MMNFHILDTKVFNSPLDILIAADNVFAACFEYVNCIGKTVHLCKPSCELANIIGFTKQ